MALRKAYLGLLTIIGLGMAWSTAASALDFDLDVVVDVSPLGDGEVGGSGFDTNGCAPGSYDYEVARDQSSLRVRFYDYDVTARGMRERASKSCGLRLTVRPPDGWAVGVEAVRVQAFASLGDRGAEAHVGIEARADHARYPASLLRRSLRGPGEGRVDLMGQAEPGGVQLVGCDFRRERSIDLLSRVDAVAGNFGSASLGAPFGGAVEHIYQMRWMRCSNGGDPGMPDAWEGQCRVVLESQAGVPRYEVWGRGVGRSAQDAVRAARQDGVASCERLRNGDQWTRCTVDESSCQARLRR